MEAIERTAAVRMGVRLEVITVVWMAFEAVLAIGAGIAARSVLLTAFGFDSVIELLSGVTLATGHGGGLYWLPVAFVLAIVIAAINAWVLLVEVLR